MGKICSPKMSDWKGVQTNTVIGSAKKPYSTCTSCKASGPHPEPPSAGLLMPVLSTRGRQPRSQETAPIKGEDAGALNSVFIPRGGLQE